MPVASQGHACSSDTLAAAGKRWNALAGRLDTIVRTSILGAGLAAALGLADDAAGRTIRVPQDYPVISYATYFSVSGDTVLVAPGTYEDQIRITAPIVLKSQAGPEVTKIRHHDDGTQNSIILILDLEGPTSPKFIVDGFGIEGPDHGTVDGIRVSSRLDPRILGTEIKNNKISKCNQPIACFSGSSSPIVDVHHNEIFENKAETYIDGNFTYNLVHDNLNPIGINQFPDFRFAHNTFLRNQVAVVFITNGVASCCIENNLFSYNRIAISSQVQASHGCNAFFENDMNCVVLDSYVPLPLAPGDLTVDPLFCNVPAGDYSLSIHSPLLVNAGCGPIGASSVGNCDRTSVLSAPWSRIKQLYNTPK